MTDAQIVIVVATLLLGLLALYVAFRLLRGLYRLVTGKKPVHKIPVARIPRRLRYDYDYVPDFDEMDDTAWNCNKGSGLPFIDIDGVYYDEKMNIVS